MADARRVHVNLSTFHLARLDALQAHRGKKHRTAAIEDAIEIAFAFCGLRAPEAPTVKRTRAPRGKGA